MWTLTRLLNQRQRCTLILPPPLGDSSLFGSNGLISLVPGFEPGPIEIVFDILTVDLPLPELDRPDELLAFELSLQLALLHLVFLPPQVLLGPLALLIRNKRSFQDLRLTGQLFREIALLKSKCCESQEAIENLKIRKIEPPLVS